MKISSTPLKGLYVLHRNVFKDSRGWFSRIFAADEFKNLNISDEAIHINASTSTSVGTLRGVHFQYPPHSEIKTVSCVAGEIWDVAVDLRPNSKTRFQWFGKILTPENGTSLIIPRGFGHAFITLKPNTTAVYTVSTPYAPDYESGIRFDDPSLNIEWPIRPVHISEKDKSWGFIDTRINELNEFFSHLKSE